MMHKMNKNESQISVALIVPGSHKGEYFFPSVAKVKHGLFLPFEDHVAPVNPSSLAVDPLVLVFLKE